MKKFFLSTCLILIASLSFSQGYFTKEEIKDYKLAVEYDKVYDIYTYNLKGKNHGGQNEKFYVDITYLAKYDTAYLNIYFTHEGKSLIGLKEALVYIDDERMTFKPKSENDLTRDRFDRGAYYYYYETLYSSLRTTSKEDMAYLKFLYYNLEDAQEVIVRLTGTAGTDQFKLKPKEIKAIDKIVSIYIDKEFPDED